MCRVYGKSHKSANSSFPAGILGFRGNKFEIGDLEMGLDVSSIDEFVVDSLLSRSTGAPPPFEKPLIFPLPGISQAPEATAI